MDTWTFLTFACMLAFALTFPSCQRAYTEHQDRLRVDAWLFKQCQDVEFAIRMRQYTDSCEHVRAMFEQSPWLVAAQKCVPVIMPTSSVAWFFTLACTFLLTPSFLLPLYRARQDAFETSRIMRNCSPFHSTIKARSGSACLL